MPRYVLSTLLLATFTAAGAADLNTVKQQGVLRLATSADFPPFNDERNGQYSGFEVELGNLIAAKLGVKPQWTRHIFDQILIDLSQNKYDLVIASHAITSDRVKHAEFSKPHYCTGGVIVSRAGGPTTKVALEGKTIAVESGSTYFGYLRKLPFKTKINIFDGSSGAAQAVVVGLADATVTDRFVGLDLKNKNPKAKLQMSDLLWREEIGMATRKGNTSLRNAVNRVLAEAMKDGSYARLSMKYFGEDIRCR